MENKTINSAPDPNLKPNNHQPLPITVIRNSTPTMGIFKFSN